MVLMDRSEQKDQQEMVDKLVMRDTLVHLETLDYLDQLEYLDHQGLQVLQEICLVHWLVTIGISSLEVAFKRDQETMVEDTKDL